jgi:hypothetical protein
MGWAPFSAREAMTSPDSPFRLLSWSIHELEFTQASRCTVARDVVPGRDAVLGSPVLNWHCIARAG